MIGDILQPTHLVFLLVVALLVLGPKRLPEMARTLGSGLRDFRRAINGEERDDERDKVSDGTPPARTEQADAPQVADAAATAAPAAVARVSEPAADARPAGQTEPTGESAPAAANPVPSATPEAQLTPDARDPEIRA